MPAILQPAPLAAPDVLVADHVAVLGGDFDGSAAVDGVGREGRGALPGPFLEAGAVRVGADVGDHEVCQVAVLVREGVY